jgi:hypothetical protein
MYNSAVRAGPCGGSRGAGRPLPAVDAARLPRHRVRERQPHLVLLRGAGRRTRRRPPIHRDEHEQAVQAVQPGHGAGGPPTRQVPVGEVGAIHFFPQLLQSLHC